MMMKIGWRIRSIPDFDSELGPFRAGRFWITVDKYGAWAWTWTWTWTGVL
jgi:hypothetical protein